MPYTICKVLEIESGHMLSKHSGNCRYPHGHSRRVELVLEADELDANDMVCDFKAVKIALEGFLDGFDHAMCMNVNDPMYAEFKKAYGDHVIGFEDKDPTTEVVTKLIFDRVREALASYAQRNDVSLPLRDSVRLKRVRVWETGTAWAEYAE